MTETNQQKFYSLPGYRELQKLPRGVQIKLIRDIDCLTAIAAASGENNRCVIGYGIPALIKGLGDKYSPDTLTNAGMALATIAKASGKYADAVIMDGVPSLLETGGYEAYKNFADSMEGYSVQSPCPTVIADMAAASGKPLLFFQGLMNSFDTFEPLREWLSNSDEAVQELQNACGFGEEETRRWKEAINRVNTYGKIREPKPETLPLIRTGHAFGVEFEKLNKEHIKEGDKNVLFEIRTPHTTSRKALQDYLGRVQDYLRNNIATKTLASRELKLLPAGYYWNMHLNVSLSKKALGNISEQVNIDNRNWDDDEISWHYRNEGPEIRQKSKCGESISEVANLLLCPANPYGRNAYTAGKVIIHTDNENVKRKDGRCPRRYDSGRLEIKGASIGKDTDIPYLLDVIDIMYTLTEHPTLIEPFRNDLIKLYSGIPIEWGEKAAPNLKQQFQHVLSGRKSILDDRQKRIDSFAEIQVKALGKLHPILGEPENEGTIRLLPFPDEFRRPSALIPEQYSDMDYDNLPGNMQNYLVRSFDKNSATFRQSLQKLCREKYPEMAAVLPPLEKRNAQETFAWR